MVQLDAGSKERLRQLAEAMRRLTAATSLTKFHAQLVEEAAAIVGAGQASLYLREAEWLKRVAQWGAFDAPAVLGLPAPARSMLGRVMESRAPGMETVAAGGPGAEVTHSLCVPLCGGRTSMLVGVVLLVRTEGAPFSEVDLETVHVLASFAFERHCALFVNVALAERERQYRLLEENIKDVFWICDTSGHLTYLSPSVRALAGMGPEDFEGLHALEGVKPAHRKAFLRALARLRATLTDAVPKADEQQTVEVQYTRTDGRVVWVESRVGPLRDETGVHNGFVGVSRDISLRKELELEGQRRSQHLMQTDKLVSLGTLVGGIAHEINNPNHLILTSTSLIQEAWDIVTPLLRHEAVAASMTAEARDELETTLNDIPFVLQHLTQGSERIRRIVSDLRDYARGDTDKLDQRVDLNAVVEQSARIMQGVVHKHVREFRCELEPALPAIQGNFVRLEQLVIQLLQNACQAMVSTRGILGARTRYSAGEQAVLLEIWDTGPGIAVENLRQVFDPFFTTKREQGCIGLGLSVGATIAQQHRAQLSVENRTEGGVLARLSFPVHHAKHYRDADASAAGA